MERVANCDREGVAKHRCRLFKGNIMLSQIRASLLRIPASEDPASGSTTTNTRCGGTATWKRPQPEPIRSRPLGAAVVDHPFISDSSEEMAQKIYFPGSVFSYFSPGFRT